MRQGSFLFVFTVAMCLAAGSWATNFAVLLGGNGSNTELKDCQSLDIDDITWDYKEVKTNEFPVEVADDLTLAKRLKYKTYQPGQPHFGNARIVAGCGKPVRDWIQASARGGQDVFRDITCVVYFDDGTPNRLYTLQACYPLSLSDCVVQADGTSTETLEVSIGGVSMEDLSNGRMRKRPELLYQAWDDTLREYVNEAYDIWGGGEEWSISQDVGTPRFRTNSPGHKTVGEITLRSAMTDGRKALCTWINETVKGKPWKRMLTVTELLSVDGARKRSYNYYDCFPVRYTFPQLDATAGAGQTSEQVTFKPIRVELK